MKNQSPLLFVSLALFLASCGPVSGNGSGEQSKNGSNEPMGSSLSSASSMGNASKEPVVSTSYASNEVASPITGDFLAFFEQGKKPSVQIEADASTFDWMSTYQSDKNSRYVDSYVPAKVTVSFDDTDYSFADVGIRVKGNMSREPFFAEGRFIAPVHFKVNFKATFDDETYDDPILRPYKKDWSEDPNGRSKRKDRNFFGLEKLDLKFVPRNGNDFRPAGMKLREIYAYDSFARNDVFAPYATLGSLTLKAGDNVTTADYEIIEPIDKAYLKRRLPSSEAKGDLYKCVYNGMGKADFSRSGAIDKSTGVAIKNGKIGVEDNYHSYAPVYQLKTNDKNMQDSDFSKMANLISGLWNCVYGSGSKQSLESLIDVNQFLKFSAISFLLGNFDDQRYNCNNLYVYFRPSDGRAIFLPYDWDWCLGAERGENMANKNPLDGWTLDGGTNSNLLQATLVGTNPQYDRQEYQQRYLAYIDALKGDVLSEDNYRALAEIYGASSEAETDEAINYIHEKLRHCA